MDILRDSAWQFIGVVISFIALFASAYFYVKTRQTKGIVYQVISNTTVLSVEEAEEVKGRVQVLFDNQPVKDARLAIIKLWNSGNKEIESKDYLEPLTISFDQGTKVLDAAVVDTKQGDAKATLKLDQNTITLDIPLLNENESITIKVLLSSFQNDLQINARIVGVKKIVNKEETTQSRAYRTVSVIGEFLDFFLSGGGCIVLVGYFVVSLVLLMLLLLIVNVVLIYFFGNHLLDINGKGNTSGASDTITLIWFYLSLILGFLGLVGKFRERKEKQRQ